VWSSSPACDSRARGRRPRAWLVSALASDSRLLDSLLFRERGFHSFIHSFRVFAALERCATPHALGTRPRRLGRCATSTGRSTSAADLRCPRLPQDCNPCFFTLAHLNKQLENAQQVVCQPPRKTVLLPGQPELPGNPSSRSPRLPLVPIRLQRRPQQRHPSFSTTCGSKRYTKRSHGCRNSSFRDTLGRTCSRAQAWADRRSSILHPIPLFLF
jgi:hypothetical protein